MGEKRLNDYWLLSIGKWRNTLICHIFILDFIRLLCYYLRMMITPVPFEQEFPEDGKLLADLITLRQQAKQKGIRFQTIHVSALPVHIGRNDKCVCGSNIKFKKCCGKE